jgi:uncharacterized integral membrane protein
MFALLGSIFKERLQYESESTADSLKKDMEALFLKTKGFKFRPNLSGTFLSEDEFIIYPKIEIGSAIAGGSTSISGKIFVNGSKSLIKTTIAPNPSFKIVFWFALIFGLIFYFDFLFITHKNSSKQVAFYFAVEAPLFIIALSFFTKTLLKISFINTFRLTRIKS